MKRPVLRAGARRSPFEQAPSSFKIRAIPTLSVVLGSLASALPIVSDYPALPPFGLMLFLGWRLLQRHVWYPWSAVLLGFFNDIASGAPGTATLTWPLIQIALDIIDPRIAWRDHMTDWRLGGAFAALYLLLALIIGNLTGGHTPVLLILPQILITILLFPLIIRICAALDVWRLR